MPTNAQLFEYEPFRHFCISIARSSYLVYNLRLSQTTKKNAEKIDTNAQWFHCSWSILLKRVNIRVRGFHLVFSDVPKTTVSQWLIYLVVWGSWWWLSLGYLGFPKHEMGDIPYGVAFARFTIDSQVQQLGVFFPMGKPSKSKSSMPSHRSGRSGSPPGVGRVLGDLGMLSSSSSKKKWGPKKHQFFWGEINIYLTPLL